ncbi:MAG: aldehyde:ferredoxin oxidoreductase [Planctomycetota bacterium]|nr:aldehyde:ferredoxin oxidoreductase [Planctomycetota bacterium]
MLPGYHGAYLRVDLATGAGEPVLLPDDVLLDFVGGVGLGTWICREEGGAEIDPLDPAAPLVFALSPLVGTPLTTSAKFAVVGRSPLTGFLSDAVSSSHFAIAAKRAGYDAYVLTGRAPSLSRLVIDEGAVSVRPAPELAGRPAADCELDGFRTAAIGRAGENGVRYATISNDGRHAGRGGLGAVLGAKNVKAFSIRGRLVTDVFDAKGVVDASRDLSQKSLGPATAKYRELGTIANVLAFNRLATLPTRNFQEATFEAAAELSAEALHTMNRVGRASCASCTIGCEHIFKPKDGIPVRLEYETLFALGSLLGVGDRDEVLRLAALCDRLGLDTISAGGTIAFAMEAGFADVGFGDAAAVGELLERIAALDPPGDLLAAGSRHAAHVLGKPELAMHVKGLEIPGYDPRTLPAMALGFAVGTRGADHNRSSAYELDFSEDDFDVARVVEIENRTASMDSLILCKFVRGVFSDYAQEAGELLRLVTGARIDLMDVGARVCSLRKLFNIEAGWRPEDDSLPERLLEGALSPAKLADMIERYNEERCWTKHGTIPRSLADRLRLSRFRSTDAR